MLVGIYLGRMIIEFWCVIPVKGINLMFEYETRRVINERRSEAHVSFLLNENRIVAIGMTIFLFLMVFMNINMYMEDSIEIYSTEDVGIQAIHYACAALPGLIFSGLSDIDKRFLKIFKKQSAIMTNQLIRIIFYPVWLYIFTIKWQMCTFGYALAFSLDNFLKFMINWLHVKMSSKLSSHLIPLSLEYFDRIDSKVDQAK